MLAESRSRQMLGSGLKNTKGVLFIVMYLLSCWYIFDRTPSVSVMVISKLVPKLERFSTLYLL